MPDIETTCASGARCIPVVKQLKHQASVVDISAASKQREAVQLFGETLSCLPYLSECLPDVSFVRLTHPSNAHEHARLLCELAGTTLSTASPGTEESIILDACRKDLESKWAIASSKLQSVPNTIRARPNNVADWLKPHQSFSGIPQSHCTEVVIQLGIRTPDLNFSKSQGVLVAGHHSLSQLHEVIYCVNNKYAAQQLGTAPSGAYMFLNDKIYVSSDVNSVDEYARPIIEFLESQNSSTDKRIARYLQLNGLKGIDLGRRNLVPAIEKMDEVTFDSLQLLPGQHGLYMYSHCGSCEHSIVVEDVRLRHENDPDLASRPMVIDFHMPHVEKCCICCARPGTRITFEDTLAPSSPAFFCSSCYDNLHLTPEGDQILHQSHMSSFQVQL